MPKNGARIKRQPANDDNCEDVLDTVSTIMLFISEKQGVIFKAADEPVLDEDTGHWKYLGVNNKLSTLIIPEDWLVLVETALEADECYELVATITIFLSKDETVTLEAAEEPKFDEDTCSWTYLSVEGKRARLFVPNGWLILVEAALEEEPLTA